VSYHSIEDEHVYQMSQRLVSFDMKDCPECRGTGWSTSHSWHVRSLGEALCLGCRGSGKMKDNSSYAMTRYAKQETLNDLIVRRGKIYMVNGREVYMVDRPVFVGKFPERSEIEPYEERHRELLRLTFPPWYKILWWYGFDGLWARITYWWVTRND
jgi:hypothetical protein